MAGFITIDTIQLPVRTITSVGGPPSYAGLMSARLGLDVFALTRVGRDFPEEQVTWLSRNGITLRDVDRSPKSDTTKFRIQANGDERSLTLLSRCDDVSPDQVPDARFNASLVSPVAGEIPLPLLSEIVKRSDFTFLDPQGYVRSFGKNGEVSVAKTKDAGMLKGVDGVKMDNAEAEAVTGKSDPEGAFRKLAASGVRKAIITQGASSCHVLDGNRVFTIPVPQVQVVDSTGAGDILAGTVVAWFLKTRDFLWSACFGIAASSLSLHMIALSKLDLPITVDDQAKRLYSQATPVATV